MSDATRGLVPTILTEHIVLRRELVRGNTVYLKADWVEPFLPGVTSDGRFTTGDRDGDQQYVRSRSPKVLALGVVSLG